MKREISTWCAVAALAAGLVLLSPPSGWARSLTVYVPPPNGTDDTESIQAALDRCVSHGPGCTVQLTAGRYLTRQLVSYNFRGTFKGRGKGVSIVEALPNLLVNSCWDPATCGDAYAKWPNLTDNLNPHLIIFADGEIRISDMTVKVTATPATQPWSFFGEYHQALVSAITIAGRYRTNASIERVAIEGRPDEATGWYGYNLLNGTFIQGVLTTPDQELANPYPSFYPLSGTFSVTSSSYKGCAAGASVGGFDEILENSRVTIGGSPATGNVFEDVVYGIDLENIQSSVVDVSYNVSSASGAGVDVLQYLSMTTKPAAFNIHHNTLRPVGPWAEGVLLADNPEKKVIYALVSRNTIEARDIGGGGVSAYGTTSTQVWNNEISGTGSDAVGFWGSTRCVAAGNDVFRFTAAPERAQIVLDEATSHCRVRCLRSLDTVLDLGTDNRVSACR